MQIKTLYDRGSALHREDFHLASLPFLVVADGVSPLYDAENPLLMVAGQSAGAVVAKMVRDSFALASPGQPLLKAMVAANYQVGIAHERWDRPLDRSDLLAGASVVAVKLSDTVEIVHVADAIAFWRLHSGEVGATENRMYDYEAHLLQIFADTMAEVGGDREVAWERYTPLRRKIVRERANRPGPGNYSVMNGQPALVPLISTLTLPREEVAELVICSDGLVPFELTQNSATLARWFFNAYDAGGLLDHGVLEGGNELARGRRHSATALANQVLEVDLYPATTACAMLILARINHSEGLYGIERALLRGIVSLPGHGGHFVRAVAARELATFK